MGDSSLLVSLHDVSPLTLDTTRRAAALCEGAGIPPSALTLLVIPFHEKRVRLDEHPASVRWLRAMSDQGATLLLHGWTHLMPGRSWSPRGLLWAHGFARGTGEFFRLDEAESRRRIDQGSTVLRRAGLGEATAGFVPPAWLLSPGARRVVEQEFTHHETLGGLWHQGQRRARRLIGWGALSDLEAHVTAHWATLQTRFPPADTRVAIHPPDIEHSSLRLMVTSTLRLLREKLVPASYGTFLSS